MNLAIFGDSPLEIALAEPDCHGNILQRDVFERPPLELSLPHSYADREIMRAVEQSCCPDSLKAIFPQILTGKVAPSDWRLWRVSVTPRRLELGFYLHAGYNPARDGLIIFQESTCMVVEDAMLLSILVHRPEPDLTAKIEVSSSGPNGTHNLCVNLCSRGGPNGSVSVSLRPEQARD